MVQKSGKRRTPPVRTPGPSGVQIGEASARALVLRGAALVFADRGLRAASVEDLLTASGISRRTFYRLYESKEDVADALYRLGTDGLVEACRAAVSRETDPLAQLRGCIDVHLKNARDLGRIVFVLGGEAQRLESSLHARRMEVHEVLVKMLHEGMPRAAKKVDPLLLRALVLALEGVTRLVLEEGDEGRKVTDESIERARRVMYRLASATLVGEGPGVTPLPTVK
ncbi:MAG TPA: TetR/AcrR family transcriptional regulator [Polyangiaceae bacterium]|nr:TetR/AcrR family transcriptional regulator [Polyangiaceae bacterium]